jgi:hypothetical protein
MSEEPIEEVELPDSFHRNRREHAGAPQHLDDDQLARLAEEEREAAGLSGSSDEAPESDGEHDGAPE